MNDITINWKKLKKFKGRLRRVIEDVPYTRDQIKIPRRQCHIKDRCIILLMASAGLRRGAIPSIMLKDLTKIDKYGLYKIAVYKKEQEQYITYCTPECARVLDQYLQWRERLGENLQPNTILIRREFDTTSHMIIAKPRPISRDSIGHNMSTLLDKTGIRPHTECHTKSNIMTCHAFRKFFDTPVPKP